MKPVKYNFPVYSRGDTTDEFTVTPKDKDTGLVLDVASARMQLRDAQNATTIYEPTLTVSAGVITIPVFPILTTQNLLGNYKYDLEVTLADGTVATYMRGTWTFLEDFTQ